MQEDLVRLVTDGGKAAPRSWCFLQMFSTAAPKLCGGSLSPRLALVEQLRWPLERLSARTQVKQWSQLLLGNMRPSSFLLTGSRESTGSWNTPRGANPSPYWLPSFSEPPWAWGLFLIPKMPTQSRVQWVGALPFPTHALLQVLLRRERVPQRTCPPPTG